MAPQPGYWPGSRVSGPSAGLVAPQPGYWPGSRLSGPSPGIAAPGRRIVSVVYRNGDQPQAVGRRLSYRNFLLFPHVNTACTICSTVIYNINILCLNRRLPCVDFMDVIMRDIYRSFPDTGVLRFVAGAAALRGRSVSAHVNTGHWGRAR